MCGVDMGPLGFSITPQSINESRKKMQKLGINAGDVVNQTGGAAPVGTQEGNINVNPIPDNPVTSGPASGVGNKPVPGNPLENRENINYDPETGTYDVTYANILGANGQPQNEFDDFKFYDNQDSPFQLDQKAKAKGKEPVQAVKQSAYLNQKRSRQRFGRGSTLLTGGQGVTGNASINRPTLLGV